MNDWVRVQFWPETSEKLFNCGNFAAFKIKNPVFTVIFNRLVD